MTYDDISEQDLPMKRQGRLEIICGAMFSGKTEELIRRAKRAAFAKQKVLLFKPNIDHRYLELKIVTHYGLEIDCIPVTNPKEIFDKSLNSDFIGIDEIQFFSEDIVEICDLLIEKRKRVVAAGLDMDYLGRPFGCIPNLLAKADFITKVHPICALCGETAVHSHRIEGGKDLIEIGEADHYIPLCRGCFKEKKNN